MLMSAFLLLGGMGIESSQDVSSRLPVGWQTAMSLLLVSQYESGAIATFFMDKDGLLTQLGKPVQTKPYLGDMVLSVDGRFLFVSDGESGAISRFSMAEDNGSLIPSKEQPVSMGGVLPDDMLLSTDRRFLFVANRVSGTISTVSITDDRLQLASRPVLTGGWDRRPWCKSANGRFLLVTNAISETISVFSIDNTQ